MEKKFYTAKHDAMFKAVFCNPKNKDLLKWLIEKCLNKKINILEVKPPQIIKRNIYEKGKTLDVLVKVDNEIVNIELNSGYYDSLHKRNAAYIFSKYTEEVKVGGDYTMMKNYIQINFTFELPNDYPLLGEYRLIDVKTNKSFIDNLKIYEYNIDKIKDLCYNKGNKEFNFIAMLDSNNEEMEKLCEGDKHMEKFKEEVENLNNDEEMVSFLTEEEDVRILRNTLMSEAIIKNKQEIAKKLRTMGVNNEVIARAIGLSLEEVENLNNDEEMVSFLTEEEDVRILRNTLMSEAFMKGESKGQKEKTLEIAKNMLLKDMNIETISEITGLRKEEIEDLK